MERKYIYIFIYVCIYTFDSSKQNCANVNSVACERTPRYLISVVRNRPPRKALGPIWLNDETRVDSELCGRREA